MSAQHNLSYKQMSMFMTGPDIKAQYAPAHADVREHPNAEAMWATKSHEAATGMPHNARTAAGGAETLKENIAREGVKEPVILGGNQILSGHHRVAAAAEVNPKMVIPVWHMD